MVSRNGEDFQLLFRDRRYLRLKNHLYNYLLRKSAVENRLKQDRIRLAIEIGSGISPVMTRTSSIVYTDISYTAIDLQRRHHGRGYFVVADARHLPFRTGIFSHGICSEVLEHIPDDRKSIVELARVLASGGRVILTVPHRKALWAVDDRFVGHYRRYEIQEMERLVADAGLRIEGVMKVLGPMEKITMAVVVFLFQKLRGGGQKREGRHRTRILDSFLEQSFKWMNRLYAVFAWTDAKLTPTACASVLMFSARKPQHRAGNTEKR